MARTALQNIEIYAPNVNNNGTFNKYVYTDPTGATIDNFPITDNCERNAQLMGDDYVRLRFNLTAYVPLAAFSFIRYEGQTFFLMDNYCPQSLGSRLNTSTNEVSSDAYEYDVKFYSVANMLRKPICYRHVVVGNNSWDEPEISVSATLETMYVIIVGSIEQYTARLDSTFLFKKMLDTLVTNGKHSTLPYTPGENVKLTAGTELSTFSFNGDNIADVCTAVANQFSDEKKETEWYIVEDSSTHALILHFCKCEDSDDGSSGISVLSDFSYQNNGSDKYRRPVITGGLSKVEYSRDTSNIPQVIVPFGAERNMTYEAVKGIDEVSQMQSTFGKRLRLEPNTTYNVFKLLPDGTKQYTTITTDSHGGIVNNQVTTGVERVEFFDDIYPQCHFRVTKVTERVKRQDGSNVPEYTCEGEVSSDSGVVFTESDFFPIQIEEGTTLSVRFESGFLNGREFEIANKSSKKKDDGTMDSHYTLRFVIVADGSVEDGTLIPSGNFIPRANVAGGYEGDKFALFNMKMPAAYITYARTELAQRAYEKLLEYQETMPDVKCTTSPRDFHGKEVFFGKRYCIHSEKIGFTLNGSNQRVPVDFLSRITTYSYKLTKPDEVQFTLSSALVRGVLSDMANAITSVTNATGGLGQRSLNLSRRGWRDASEVAEKIDSMTTEMMLVGNEKYQFGFTSAIQCEDANNRPNENPQSGAFDHLRIGYGTLQHTQQPYVEYHNGGLWEISAGTLDVDSEGAALDAEEAYYVYADCQVHSAGAQATIGLYLTEQAGDDYLLLGILSSEFENQRVFSRTNGFTAIAGGTITTEQIQDANRQLIIDFQSNPPRIIAVNGAEIFGNIKFRSFKDENDVEVLDVMSEAIEDAQEAADDAMQKARDIVDDCIISGGTEKATIKKEWQEIAGDNMLGNTDGSYKKADAQGATYGLPDATTAGSLRKALKDAYTALETAMKEIVGYANNAWTNTNMETDTYLDDGESDSSDGGGGEERSYLALTRDEFSALWRTYYDAEIALLNAVSDTIDQKEIGGENLYTKEDPLRVTFESDSVGVTLVNGKKYVVSIQSSTGTITDTYLRIYERTGTEGSYTYTLRGNITALQNTMQYRVIEGHGGELVLRCSANQSGKYLDLVGVMVQQGEKPTTYQPNYEFLAEAFEHDATKLTTSIDGGLIISALLKLVNQSNAVTAGISGLTDGLVLWGGGTYADALSDLAGTTDKLPLLLSSDQYGIGTKLGILRIKKDTSGNHYIQVDDDGVPSIQMFNDRTAASVISELSPTTNFPAGSSQSTDTVKVVGKFYEKYQYQGRKWYYEHYVNGSLVQETQSTWSRSTSATKVLLNKNMTLEASQYKFLSKVSLGADLYASQQSTPSSGTYAGSAEANYSVRLTITNVYSNEVVGTHTFSATPNTSQIFSTEIDIEKSFTIPSKGTYNIKIDVIIEANSTAPGSYNTPASDVEVYGTAQGFAKYEGGSLTNLSSRTVLCKDGFVYLCGGYNFTLRQDISSLDVRMVGLPETKPSDSGRLYTQSMTVNGTTQKVICIS